MAYFKHLWEWIDWFYHYAAILILIFIRFIKDAPQPIGNSRNNRLKDLNSSADTRKFKVYIYEGELEYIKRLVLQRYQIETGGDLFGLWLDAHNVVVQFVLGPGQKCRRSSTSFYQDVDYLESVGNYITKNQGLCNIGQWHSHHRLDLPRPSSGDENTVWNNMPHLGMERYVVFIATIKDSGFTKMDKVNVNCFLFEIENETKLPVLEGEICVLTTNVSPVRERCSELTALVESGMEDNTRYDNSVAVNMEIE